MNGQGVFVNVWQVCRQLRFLIKARKWEDDSNNELVFDAYVSDGPTEDAKGDLNFPCVFIHPEGGPADEEHPELWKEGFKLTVVASVETDFLGEEVLIGGARSAGSGSSAGRGVLELDEELFGAVGVLAISNGIPVQAKHVATLPTVRDPDLGFLASRKFDYEITCESAKSYEPVEKFTAVDAAGAGDADLAWSNPADRFDRREIVVRRASGATAPSSPSGGTGVTLPSLLVESVTDNPGVGQFSYAIFVGYDETESSTNQRFSLSATATVTVT